LGRLRLQGGHSRNSGRATVIQASWPFGPSFFIGFPIFIDRVASQMRVLSGLITQRRIGVCHSWESNPCFPSIADPPSAHATLWQPVYNTSGGQPRRTSPDPARDPEHSRTPHAGAPPHRRPHSHRSPLLYQSPAASGSAPEPSRASAFRAVPPPAVGSKFACEVQPFPIGRLRRSESTTMCTCTAGPPLAGTLQSSAGPVSFEEK
jgi:hypothetical protein